MTKASTDTGKILQELVHLDYDAIEAYEAAIERLDNPEFKARLTEYCDDHRRHTDNLVPYLQELGAEVPRGPDLKQILTEGKVVIGGLAGDKGILIAMRANEEVTNKAYEKALEHATAGTSLHATLLANYGDEQRHRAWIKQTLESL